MSKTTNPAGLAETIFTVGHSNRSLAEFVEILRSAKIQTLVDVRRFPMSRRHPHFNTGPLRDELASIGVAYRHLPELGGYRESRGTQCQSPNDGWPSGFLRNYADYAMTETFQAALTAFRQSLRPRSALMCAEKSWRDCHRQIISDYLIANSHQVTHLVDAKIHEDGRLTAFARLLDRNTIDYRANPAQLRLDV